MTEAVARADPQPGDAVPPTPRARGAMLWQSLSDRTPNLGQLISSVYKSISDVSGLIELLKVAKLRGGAPQITKQPTSPQKR